VDEPEVLLHPLLAGRWSPTKFDTSYDATPSEVATILEAARWAPSAGNSQPWAFIVGRRGEPVHARLVRHLAGSSAPWASTASLLIANLCHRFVEDTDWDYSEFALYDLGQAVAHMTFQAQVLGCSRGSSVLSTEPAWRRSSTCLRTGRSPRCPPSAAPEQTRPATPRGCGGR
jgi:nitroreductase